MRFQEWWRFHPGHGIIGMRFVYRRQLQHLPLKLGPKNKVSSAACFF
jgi:hypothetical protein